MLMKNIYKNFEKKIKLKIKNYLIMLNYSVRIFLLFAIVLCIVNLSESKKIISLK